MQGAEERMDVPHQRWRSTQGARPCHAEDEQARPPQRGILEPRRGILEEEEVRPGRLWGNE